MVAATAAVAACWGSMLALRFKSQSAAPLMQAGMMGLILLTPAYAPLALLQKGFRIFIDTSALPLDKIYLSGGQRGVNLSVSPADIVKVTGAMPVTTSPSTNAD